MTLQKQIDAIIEWTMANKRDQKWIDVTATTADLSKFSYKVAGKIYYRDFELRIKK